MKSKDWQSVAAALDTLVLHQQAKLAKELIEKKNLRHKQVGITSEANEAFETLQSFDASDAVTHAFRQARLKKLQEMQIALQPDLAKAALRREIIQNDLRGILRKQLAVRALMTSLKAKAAADPDEAAIETSILARAFNR